jgi:hypothetical protein
VTVAVLTPFSSAPAVELGNRLWRKKVLPVGDVEYKGRTLHFTLDYLKRLARSFTDRAYDQVAFQLADAANTHTNDPERFRGEIVAMDAEPDGLWLTLHPTEAGDRVLHENPKLGVSARIVEDYARSDGKRYPAAIQHVLGTLDPRIPGLGAWQAIEAATPTPDKVWDLSSSSFAGEDGEPDGSLPAGPTLTTPVRTDMADLDALDDDQKQKLARLLALPDDQIDALAAGGLVVSQEELEALTTPDDGETDDDLAEAIEAMSDEELAELEAQYEAENGYQEEREPVGAAMSQEAMIAIELAEARQAETERELATVTARLHQEDYEAEKRRLADLGVPPFITELAKPLLEGAGHAVELANGNVVDAGQIMRKVLSEYARTARMLDLDVELGSPLDISDDVMAEAGQQARDERSEIVNRFKNMTGLR